MKNPFSNSNNKKDDNQAVSSQTNESIPSRIEMTDSVFKEMVRTIGKYPAETGGILGMRGDKIVEFFFDAAPNKGTRVSYTPNHNAINKVLSEKWTPSGTIYMGAVHSHPIGIDRPSYGDEDYAKRLLEHMMKNFDKAKLYFYIPIVYSAADTDEFRLYSYIACFRNGRFNIENTTLYIDGSVYTPTPMTIYRPDINRQRYQPAHGTPYQKPTYGNRIAQNISNSYQPNGYESPTVVKKVDIASKEESCVNKTKESTASVVDNPVLSKIEITAIPENISCCISEKFNPRGMVVTATYNNGKTKDVTSLCDYSEVCSTSAVEKTVDISYSENDVKMGAKFKLQFTFSALSMSSKTAVLCNCSMFSGDYVEQLVEYGISNFVLLGGLAKNNIENLNAIKKQILAINHKASVTCVDYIINEKTTEEGFLTLVGVACKNAIKGLPRSVLFVDLLGKYSQNKRILELARFFGSPFIKMETTRPVGDLEISFRHLDTKDGYSKCIVKAESNSYSIADVLNSIKMLMCLRLLSSNMQSQVDDSICDYATKNNLQVTFVSPDSTPAMPVGTFAAASGSRLNSKV